MAVQEVKEPEETEADDLVGLLEIRIINNFNTAISNSFLQLAMMD